MSTQPALTIQIIPGDQLSPELSMEILAMCQRAYEEDLGSLWETFSDPQHVLAFQDSRLVSHAMWVTRWLQPNGLPVLRTAYVELVATEPADQSRGYASAVMQALQAAIQDFDLGGLSPAETTLYSRLGWEYWRGPLFVRTPAGLEASPADEVAMILRLPSTPALDLDASLSAEWRPGEPW